MRDNKGKCLGAINVKQSWELIFNFCILSRDKSALFVECVRTQTAPVLSIKSRLLMAMLRHNLETGRMVSEIAFSAQILGDESIEDLKTAWKATAKLELVTSYFDAFSEMLKSIAERPSQSDLFEESEPHAGYKPDAFGPVVPVPSCKCRRCQLNHG
jgi:hypothetical protein